MSASMNDPDARFVSIARAHRSQLQARLDILQTLIAVYEATMTPVAVAVPPAPAPALTPPPAPVVAPMKVETATTISKPAAPTVIAAPSEPTLQTAIVAAPPPLSEPKLNSAPQKTPERVALLRTLYNQTPRPTPQAMLDRLNALPGARIPMSNLTAYVAQWGARTAPLPTVVPPKPLPAAQPVAEAVGMANRPVVVSQGYAIQWGAERGIPGPKLDLAAINATRRRLMLPQFIVEGRD